MGSHRSTGLPNHPTSPLTCTCVRASMQEGDAAGCSGRVIIFTNFREGVMAICEALRSHEPLITARWGLDCTHAGQGLLAACMQAGQFACEQSGMYVGQGLGAACMQAGRKSRDIYRQGYKD